MNIVTNTFVLDLTKRAEIEPLLKGHFHHVNTACAKAESIEEFFQGFGFTIESAKNKIAIRAIAREDYGIEFFFMALAPYAQGTFALKDAEYTVTFVFQNGELEMELS